MESESLFKAFEHKAKYRHIFDYKRDVGSVNRQLRIALRPFVLAISGSTDLARLVRRMGEAAGYTFPQVPAKVTMRGPTPVLDYLSPSDTSSFLPLPELMCPTEGVEGLDPIKVSMIRSNADVNAMAMRGYQEQVAKLFNEFYTGVVHSSLTIDNSLQFSSELFGHVDGALVELARSKLLSLFRGRASGEFFFLYSFVSHLKLFSGDKKDPEKEEGGRSCGWYLWRGLGCR